MVSTLGLVRPFDFGNLVEQPLRKAAATLFLHPLDTKRRRRELISACSLNDIPTRACTLHHAMRSIEQNRFNYPSLHLRESRSSDKESRSFKTFKGGVSHTAAHFWSQVLTPRDRMFTGEVNISDYAHCVRKCNILFRRVLVVKTEKTWRCDTRIFDA